MKSCSHHVKVNKTMENNKHYPFWVAGMSAIAVVIMTFSIANIKGITLADNVVRTLGFIEMIGIVTVVYTTVKLKAVKNSGRLSNKKRRK